MEEPSRDIVKLGFVSFETQLPFRILVWAIGSNSRSIDIMVISREVDLLVTPDKGCIWVQRAALLASVCGLVTVAIPGAFNKLRHVQCLFVEPKLHGGKRLAFVCFRAEHESLLGVDRGLFVVVCDGVFFVWRVRAKSEFLEHILRDLVAQCPLEAYLLFCRGEGRCKEESGVQWKELHVVDGTMIKMCI